MKPELTVESWLDAFARHLQEMERRDGRLSRVASFGNGFEGWLKVEMATLLTAPPWNYQPWNENGAPGDVGMEYRATLGGGEQKLIDAWASPRGGATSWLFAELKVAFRYANSGKQLESWVRDFELLRRIDRRFTEQRVSAVTSVMFGVGFTVAQFEDAIQRAVTGLHVPAVWARTIETAATPVCMRALVAALD